MASSLRRANRNIVATTGTVVQQLWLKLRANTKLRDLSDPALRSYMRKAMRTFLSDSLKSARAAKRGAGSIHVPVDESIPGPETFSLDDSIDFHDALDRLSEADPRHGTIVEMRYFGHTSEEIAEELHIGRASVENDFRAAKAWLNSQLRRSPPSDSSKPAGAL